MIRLAVGETRDECASIDVQLGRAHARLRLVPRFERLYLVVFETFVFDASVTQEEPNGFKIGEEDHDGWRSISCRRGRFWAHLIIGKREPWFIRVMRKAPS